jgi:hypothetical protein
MGFFSEFCFHHPCHSGLRPLILNRDPRRPPVQPIGYPFLISGTVLVSRFFLLDRIQSAALLREE